MISIFTALPLLWRIGIATAAIAALAGTYAVWHHKVYQSGYDAAIAAIAAKDQAAIDRVTVGERVIKDCRERGGSWDVVTGTCI